MAVQELLQKTGVALKLNNGTKAGVVQTVSLSLGTLDKDEWDADKAMAIIDLLEPCLSKGIEEVVKTTQTKLVNA